MLVRPPALMTTYSMPHLYFCCFRRVSIAMYCGRRRLHPDTDTDTDTNAKL